MREPMTIVVTSNKGGSGKTPIGISTVIWALSKQQPWRVLAIDINHTNQDLFQALSHLSPDGEGRFETAFTLPKTGTAYYLPLSDRLHLVRSRAFQPLSPPQVFEMIGSASAEYAKQKGQPRFEPDLIVLDANYCFPSYRMTEAPTGKYPAMYFFNIWSITSPHELRTPVDYRTAISEFRDASGNQTWDSTNFIHIFTLLEKERKISSEVTRLVKMQRAIYSVAGSDDLADLYRRTVLDTTTKSTGFSFDQIQKDVFTPILAEIESLTVEDPSAYSEDVMNARWIERLNIFLSTHRVYPLNVLPLPHHYPHLRRNVVDMILRERLSLDLVKRMFGDFFTWMSMFMERRFAETGQ
ncbi:MAG: hypothetical protein HXY34_10050 [Candidatus Thorarchaeota archaeon]|nr:hypothetical protein [Candidatus Thorarchaeota archaeon]